MPSMRASERKGKLWRVSTVELSAPPARCRESIALLGASVRRRGETGSSWRGSSPFVFWCCYIFDDTHRVRKNWLGAVSLFELVVLPCCRVSLGIMGSKNDQHHPRYHFVQPSCSAFLDTALTGLRPANAFFPSLIPSRWAPAFPPPAS